MSAPETHRSQTPPSTTAATARPQIVHSRRDLKAAAERARAEGKTIGVVPTMGALHAGHLSLAEAACRECGFVIVTIFVNPTQFGPQEDFQIYPRTLDADVALLETLPIDVVYAPSTGEMYPDGFATFVEAGGAALPWEGAQRPGHFRGVATVVLKLFMQTSADVAYFGQKDFQQTRVVRQMVRDFDLPVRIQICPTVREPDGLALSSRNAYLAPDQRRQALVLSQSLRLARELIEAGERSAAAVVTKLRELYDAQPGVQLDYLAIADPDTLEEVSRIGDAVVVAVAARVGETRLIDNELIGTTADTPHPETRSP